MARAISDEELQLKRRARRRLIGAVVLVTAIIVILPMVLDSEPKAPGQEVSVKIPSPDSAAFTSKVAPTPAAAPESKTVPKAPEPKPAAKPLVEEAKKIAAAPPVVEAPPAVKETPKEVPQPALKAETELSKAPPAKAPAKPAAKKPKPAAKPAAGKFVVQVIALADAERAKQMQGQIAAAGIKSYTEVVKTAKGDVTRVRAGPFATRQAAEKAREQLKALGMSGNIATK